MALVRCTEAFLDATVSEASLNVSVIPIEVLQSCIWEEGFFHDLISLNRTNCVESVLDLKTGVDYVCTHYYLTYVWNQTTGGDNCRQFYHMKSNLFDVQPCYTIGESISELLKVSSSPFDLTIFVFAIFYVIYACLPTSWCLEKLVPSKT